jgi:hypothetical protein
VVDEHGEPAAPGRDSVNGGLEGCLIGDIHMPKRCSAPLRDEFVGESAALGDTEVENRNCGAFFGHAAHTRLSDPDRAAGNNGDLTGKSVHGGSPASVGSGFWDAGAARLAGMAS